MIVIAVSAKQKRINRALCCGVAAIFLVGMSTSLVFAQEQGASPSLPVSSTASPIITPAGDKSESDISLGMTADVASLSEEELPPEIKILRKIESDLKKRAKKKKVFLRSSIPSLVFTPQQYALLREARIGFNTRIPTLQELKDPGDPNDPNYHRGIIVRELKLGGIAYVSPDDWTIWLNNARVTPDALPQEAVDVKVFKDFIELRWYDIKTDQIFPVRMRTNQKFNLDTHIFLPG